jgi:hypothetical protein
MVVETNLETGMDAPGYDPTALEKLIAVAMRGEARTDRIRVVPNAPALTLKPATKGGPAANRRSPHDDKAHSLEVLHEVPSGDR